MPGEFREFTPRDLGPEWSDIPTVTAAYSSLELHGTCRDAFGDSHAVDEVFDLREWWQSVVAAHERVERGPKTPVVKALDEIAKAIKPNQPFG
jgi:hypothetical protein